MIFSKKYFLSLLFISFTAGLLAQSSSLNNFTEDETNLYLMNKQVGQFENRFNMEEDQYGKLLPLDDKNYRNNELRKKVLPGLFDKENPRTSGNLQEYFITDVTNPKNPVYLDFHDQDWYGEVSATFTNNKGKDVNIILYLTLEKENKGSKWILTNAYYNMFPSLFPKNDSLVQTELFLHPMSHELDFMNLHKALEDEQNIQYYASQYYQPDYLTLFFYEMKTGQLKFKQINSVKFHFFQIENWYFELSYFNRNSSNSGWLISNLQYVNENDKKELIKTYRICTSKN